MRNLRGFRSIVPSSVLAGSLLLSHNAPAASATPSPTSNGINSSAKIAVGKPNMIAMPHPEYPLEARREMVVGAGRYQLLFRDDGKIASVSVVKSTGSKLLDSTCVQTFQRWRAVPGALKKVTVPVRFTFGNNKPGVYPGPISTETDSQDGQSRHALGGAKLKYAPWPAYPNAALNKHLEGHGIFRIIFDKHGYATHVEVKRSTGEAVLDAAAVAVLKKWQVFDGSAIALIVPLSYVY